MSWTTPITDRTQEDVTYARTHQDSSKYLKGAFNYTDWNRVRNNYYYLVSLLASGGIYFPWSSITGATERLLVTKQMIDVIRDDIFSLANPYLRGLGFSEFPKSEFLGFEEVNEWERIEQTAYDTFEKIKKEYIFCGTIDSGGDRLL